MNNSNDNNEREFTFDVDEVTESIAEHVEKQMETHEQIDAGEQDAAIYSDAGYILSEEAPTTPRCYYTPPEKEEKPPKPEPPKKKNDIFGKVMAGVLAGTLMGAAIGVGVMGLVSEEDPPSADEGPPAIVSPTPAPTPSPLLTINNSDTENQKNATDIYAAAISQVVGIRTEISGYNVWGQPTTNAVSGTGFIVSSDGYILTNHHVIEDALKGGYDVNVILYNGDSYVATIVGAEGSDSDVAVLKIDAENLTPVAIGDSSVLSVGETIYAVGNPLGELTYTMTSGMVSALDREITTGSSTYSDDSTTMNMFQIDAAVNSGNSGGPVYNSLGEVVGVVTAKYSASGAEGLGFAIPINDAIDIANDLIEQGYVSGKPSLGITVETMPQNVCNYYGVPMGAYVYYIEEGSTSAEAGLLLGDIITGVDSYEIASSSDLKLAKKEYRAGDTAMFTVYRDADYITLNITFGEERPNKETSSENGNAPAVSPNSYFDYYQSSRSDTSMKH